MLERSAAAQREELCPLAGQASLWRAEKETVQQKVFLQIRQKSIQFYKDKGIEKKEAENPHFQTPYPYLRGAP